MNSGFSSYSQTVTDARGIPVVMPRHPRRIVSLICSITETLFDFGAGNRLVGRTNFCVKPPRLVDAVLKIGGPKNPDIDRIIAQRPDLVIANIEENEKHDIEKLEKENIPVFTTFPRTIADSLELLRTLGRVTGTEEAAETYYHRAERIIRDVSARVGAVKNRPAVLYLIWRKPYMTVNRDTYIHDMIAFCGGTNVFAEHSVRYPAITVEEMAASQPDIIVLPSEPFRFQERHASEIRHNAGIPAVRNNAVLFADGELFSWFGTRMIHGIPYVYNLLRRQRV